MFEKLCDKNNRSDSRLANHTGDFLVFCLKMKLIGKELDYAIGARLARIILE
jgi:hypothetical protein